MCLRPLLGTKIHVIEIPYVDNPIVLAKTHITERPTYKTLAIGGWGGESNREIVSFRSCVRASERARDQRFDCCR